MNWLLLAASLLSTEFNVRAGDATYNEKQDETVVIAMPNDKYTCSRRPVVLADNKALVTIVCEEHGTPAFMLGGLCHTDKLDENIAMLTLNVGTAGAPIVFPIAISCRTIAEKKTVL